MPKGFEGTLSAWLGVQIYEKDKLIEKHPWQQSHSFVENFIWHLVSMFGYRQISTGISDPVLDTAGVDRGLDNATNEWIEANGDAAEDTQGILVGTNNTAVSLDDYALGTKIAHGAGAGQLEYAQMSFTWPDIDGSNVDCANFRRFDNNSGGSITVEEVGLVGYSEGQSGTAYYFLLARDLKNFAISNGQAAVVEYRLRTTV